MTRCLGIHLVKMDDKGRVFVPAQYRDEFRVGAKLVYRDDYIGLYAQDEFDLFMEALDTRLADGIISRDFYNRVTRLTELATTDSQGRIVVPKKMRDALGLDQGEIAIDGYGSHFAIKHREAAAEDTNAAYNNAGQTHADLSDMGL